MPPWQFEPGFVQDVVHAPQAPASRCRSRHRGPRESQRVSLAGHWQTPPAHVAPVPHRTPHAPQLFASVWKTAGSMHVPPHHCPVHSLPLFAFPQPATASADTRATATARCRAMAESYATGAPPGACRAGESTRGWRVAADPDALPR